MNNNNSDFKKINKKFKFDEKEIILINQPKVSELSEEDEDSFKELSQDESKIRRVILVHQANHKDFTSSDLKEDEIFSIDQKLVSTNTNPERRLNRNSGSLENEMKNYVGGINIKEDIEIENDDNNNDDQKLNMKKKQNKLSVKNKMYENKPSIMERISEADIEEEKINTMFDKLNDGENREEFKMEKNFDEFMNKENNLSNLKEYFDPNFNNTDSTYRFKQEISQNNKQNNTDQQQAKKALAYPKRVEVYYSIYLKEDLYKDAINRKKKREMIEENNVMNILLNANKTKISNNSHKIAINKIEKYIEYVIYTHDKEKTKKITFIDLGYILTELKVFREILKEENKKQNEYSSYKEIKFELKNLRDNEKRRKIEIDFYEQIWIVLNPDNSEFIKVNILAEFLKILFSPVSSSVKEISSVLKQFLQTAFFLNSNAERKKKYISPITEKSISDEEIWPLEKLVKEFLNLKQNILAYQSINNIGKRLNNDLEQRNFSFTPQILNNKNDNNRKNFFNGRLNDLVFHNKMKYQILQEDKNAKEDNILRDYCTFKPKINKKFDSTKSTENVPVYLKLYKLQEEKIEKMAKVKEQIERMKDDEFTKFKFKPKLESNIKNFEKSKNKEKHPKFDEVVDRIRSAIQKKIQHKKMLEYTFDNKKYERFKKIKDHIQPFNITDLTKKNDEDENKKNQKKKNDDEYFSIQISVAKGKDRLLKVNKNDNPLTVAENFCRVYGLKNDDIVERLAITIQNFMNIYLANNENLDIQNNMENDIFENIDTNVLNQLQTNNNNTNVNISKEFAASKASIISNN